MIVNGGDFGAMLRRLQDTFTESEPWEEQRPGYWSTFIGIADDRFSLWLMLPFANANRYARAEALLVTRDIPPGVRTEMAVFSLFANRFFSGWDLFVKDFDEDGLRVNSVGTFVAIESIDALPPQLVETLVARTVRTAVVAVPAVQAIIEGASAAEALKIADRHDDEVGSFDPAHDVSVGDEALIDDAEGAVAAVEGTVIWGFRSDATQLQIHSYAVGGAIEPGRFFAISFSESRMHRTHTGQS